MALTISNCSCMIFFIYGFMTLSINGFPTIDHVEQNQPFTQKEGPTNGKHLISGDLSKPLMPVVHRQRSVIMPRICYFARITARGIYQKICLPYGQNQNSELQPIM